MKKYKFNHLLTLLISVILYIYVQADTGEGGQPGAFLRIPINARANGMGGAFTAIADDPSALWWNPGGLGFINRIQLMGMYTRMSLDRQHNFAGVSFPIQSKITIGISWLQFGVSEIEGRDIFGQPTEKFDDNETMIGGGAAYRFSEKLSIGFFAKYIYHSLYKNRATGFGFDGGIKYQISKIFKAGFTFQNLSTKIKWNTDSNLEEVFPQLYRAGIAVYPPKLPIVLALDIGKIQHQKNYQYNVGLEANILPNIFSLRGGYGKNGFTAGAALGWKNEGFLVHLDFAYLQDVFDRGFTQQFSLVLGF